MGQSREHRDGDVAAALRGKIVGLDGKNSSARHKAYGDIQREILDDPYVLPEAISALKNGLSELRHAPKILELVQKEERIFPKLKDSGYLAGLLTHLTGEHAQWAEDMFVRWATKPLESFKKTKESAQEMVQQYVSIVSAFAEALRLMDMNKNDTAVQKAMVVWNDHLVRPDIEDLSPFDFFLFYPKLPDADLRYKGALALSTLTLFESIHKKEEFPFDNDMMVRQGKKADILRWFLSELPLHEDSYEYHQTIRLFDRTVDTYMSAENSLLVFPTPWVEDEDAQYILQRYYEMTVAWLRKEGHEAAVHFLPGKLPLIFSVRGGLDLQEAIHELEGQVLGLHLNIAPPSWVSSGLSADEIGYVADKLVLPVEKEVLAQRWQKDLERVQRGWRALSIRGNIVKLDQAEDESIKRMGLTQILYQPVRGGVDVRIFWGAWHVDVKLDARYRPVRLDHIPQESQDWLMAHMYGYLAEIKGSDIRYEKVLYKRGVDLQNNEAGNDEEAYPYEVDSYLRVLHKGHKPSLEQEALDAAQFDFGIDLKLFNAILLHCQEAGQDVETTLTQFGVAGEERETYKIRAESAFERIALRPHSEGHETDPKYYQITYVRPYTAENAPREPRIMRMPEVTRQLLQLHQPR